MGTGRGKGNVGLGRMQGLTHSVGCVLAEELPEGRVQGLHSLRQLVVHDGWGAALQPQARHQQSAQPHVQHHPLLLIQCKVGQQLYLQHPGCSISKGLSCALSHEQASNSHTQHFPVLNSHHLKHQMLNTFILMLTWRSSCCSCLLACCVGCGWIHAMYHAAF